MLKSPVHVRERILSVASDLFRRQGYSETGINQIIVESSSAKASFYQHFPSKEALGIAYLRESYGAQQFELLERLKKRNPNPEKFLKAWVYILKREARKENLYGCAMANLRAQTFAISPVLAEEVTSAANHILNSLTDFLNTAKQQRFLDKKVNTTNLARKLFIIYEGVIHVYKLTGDSGCLDDLYNMGNIIIRTA